MTETERNDFELFRAEVNYVYSALASIIDKAKSYKIDSSYIEELEKAEESLNNAEVVYKNILGN